MAGSLHQAGVRCWECSAVTVLSDLWCLWQQYSRAVQCKGVPALHYNRCAVLHLGDLQENTFCHQASSTFFFFLFRKSDSSSVLNDDCSQTGKGEQLRLQ